MNMNLFIRWLLSAITLIIVSYIVPGFSVSSFWSALLAAALLGLVNIVIRPILLVLTLPVNVLSLGLFTFVINALMLLLVSSVIRGFELTSFWSALAAAVVLWLVSALLDMVFEKTV